jgi:glycosyltransferase involved in cell wall biosynthesis
MGPGGATPAFRLYVTTSYPRFEGDPAGCFVQARVRRFVAAGGRALVLAAGDPAGADALMTGSDVQVQRIACAVAGAPPLFYAGGAPERLEAGGAGWLPALRLWGGVVTALRAWWSESGSLRGALSVESHWLVPSGAAVAFVVGGEVDHRAFAHSGDVALLERLPGGASLARLLLRRGARPVFVSADLRARFAELAGAPLAAEVVATCPVEPAESPLIAAPPRPVPAAARRALRVRLGLSGRVVLGVGRLVPIKGYDLLVRAIGRLDPASRPSLVLLGEGPERPHLVALATRRGVDLRLPGQVPAAEVLSWLTAADLFVHPSRRLTGGRTEGQPLAIREALAAGLPVIATDTGGVRELVSTGLTLVSAEDPDALARAISRYAVETRL